MNRKHTAPPGPHDAMYADLGRRVRAYRMIAGVSQTALAEAVDMDRTSIVNIEAGRQRPTLHMLVTLAEVLRVTAADLLPDVVFEGEKR